MKVLVLHGPNLNLLGERPGDNQEWSLETVNHAIEEEAASLGLEVKVFQSNHEGTLIDTLHGERKWAEAVIINPAELAHSSYVLREAIAAVGKPTIEVHLTELPRRETRWRRAVLKDVCVARVIGKGVDSYLIALRSLARSKLAADPATKRQRTAPKTIGRPAASAPEQTKRSPSPSDEKNGPLRDRMPGGKSIGRSAPAAKARPGDEFLSRALVRQKIADRLAGKVSASGLATWARRHWLEVQRGAPAESGQRELLEDCLQSLVVSATPASKLSEDQLIELMTQLE
jgi:3-dehydroquinate dehydratase II